MHSRPHDDDRPLSLRDEVQMPRKLLLMRGLPSCGKSTRAKELVADGGLVFEFDEYFYTQVGTDSKRYDWSRSRLDDAREWNVARICSALDRGDSPIVLDDDNGLGQTTRRCVKHAVQLGYQIEFREPTSPWWREIRELLRDKNTNREALASWANKLTGLSRGTHRVSYESFLRRIERWQDALSTEVIIDRALTAPSQSLRAS